MIELLGLALAIVLVLLVQLLRGILSMPFARLRSIPVGRPSALQEAFLQAQVAQLQALGFAAPRWLASERVDGVEDVVPLRGVLRHADGLGLCWLAPPVNSRLPHRPLIYFSHRLQDGRVAISQAFDCYFALIQGEQLVARTAGESSLAEQWQAHLRWLQTLGSPPQVLAQGDIDDLAGPFMERQRQALIRRGDLHEIDDNLALPRLGFALRALWAYLRLPKSPPDPRPVAPAQLLGFARIQERVQRRSPPRAVQWQLFAASVTLFMLAGALVWDLQFALAILVVVLIHELGHFLAMRAFGYRNVHVLALPLVGGVAMGVDAKPSATRRAWMSLMGPLPGIIIGWALLALLFLIEVPDSLHAPLLALAIAFLAINYLNVLPVPPLDGAHVVESLLPPRWARVQTVFAAAAAVLGAALAWHWDLAMLGVLALLQLPALWGSWRLHGVERQLAAQPVPRLQSRGERLLQLFALLDRELGPTAHAVQRVRQALHVEHRLATRPMGAGARLLTGGVYLALLAGPLALLLLWGVFAGEQADMQAAFERQRSEEQAWQAEAVALSQARLLSELADMAEQQAGATVDAAPRPAPASVQRLEAAEQRLGRALPDELRQFYAAADGLPALSLHGIEQVVPAQAVLEREIAPYSETLLMELPGEVADWVELPLAEAHGWWWLGGGDEAPLFYLPEPHPRLPGVRVIEYFAESPSTYPSLRAWLDAQWVAQQQLRAMQVRRVAAEREARQQLAGADIAGLLQVWPRPQQVYQALGHVEPWPDPAEPGALVAAERRLGQSLPAELRELYALHDGIPSVRILAAGGLTRWDELPAPLRERIVHPQLLAGMPDAAGSSGAPLPALAEVDLAGCLVVGGFVHAEFEPGMGGLSPQLLWCAGGALPGWLDLGIRRRHASLRDWLLERAVSLQAVNRVATDTND